MTSYGGGGSASTNVPPSPTATKPKKSKKKGGAKAKAANGDPSATTNGHNDEADEGSGQQDKLVAEEEEDQGEHNGSAITPGKGVAEIDTAKSTTELPLRSPQQTRSRAGTAAKADVSPSTNTTSDPEDFSKERSALREEVARLHAELGEGRSKYAEELDAKDKQLEEVQAEKEQADSNYRTLLGRVSTIKSQLGERLKEDAEELSQCRAHIEELESQIAQLKTQDETRASELAQLAEENESQSKELLELRNNSTLTSQQWEEERDSLRRERDDWQHREAYAREEFGSAKQAMQDWEILAMEERSIRENLGEKVAELEEQLSGHREAREKLEAERQGQDATVDGLQRALQELQQARKTELREVVENSQAQLENLRKEVEEAQAQASGATSQQQKTQIELERLLPLEAEVKEKTVLIGKLKHQAVGLNEHLTKAYRQISRKGKPEDNIDRELVTNHLLQFLNLDRSDPRKFQILQILASILQWTEDQQERAGLSRPGASNPSLRTPISPWNRTPSTPSLNTLAGPDGHGRQDSTGTAVSRQESIGTAFAEFLEKESEAGTRSHSRETSVSDRK